MKHEIISRRDTLGAGRRDEPTASSTLRVDEPIGLTAIAEPHVSVVVLRRRDGYESLAAYATGVARGLALRIEEEAAFDALDGLDAIDSALKSGLPPDDARDALAEDVAYWIEWMTELTGASRVLVRLLRVAFPVFPDFYVDPGSLRLVCTYAGAPSEWLDHRDVDRSLGTSRRLLSSAVIRRDAVVERCQPMDVVLFKGQAWPGMGAIQRAPSTTEPRLLLSIEPVWPRVPCLGIVAQGVTKLISHV